MEHCDQMVALQLEISRYVTGFVHVQTNPYDSFSTEKTLASARSESIWDSTLLNRAVCSPYTRNCEPLQATRSSIRHIASVYQDPLNLEWTPGVQSPRINRHHYSRNYSVHDGADTFGRRSRMPLYCPICEWAQGSFRTWVRFHYTQLLNMPQC